MKKKIAIIGLLCVAGAAFGQGSLTPPGAPAPTMKTLDELDVAIASVSNSVIQIKDDARTPLPNNGTTINITQSGSYYLTNNLTVASGNGVSIDADGVTLDLNGFTIRSTEATPSSSGVYIYSSDVTVFNGHITSGTTYDSGASGDQYTGSGFKNGINANYSNSKNIQIRNLSVSGCDQYGIYIAGDGSKVESCAVHTVGSCGIYASTIKNSTAITCGSSALQGMIIADCKGSSTGATAIYSSGTVNNSYGYTTSTSTSADGIYASKGVQNSYGYSAGDDGIASSGTVANSYGQTISTITGAYGIYASKGVQNSYGSSKGDDGIYSGGTVANSYGYADSTSTSAKGISALGSVQNSFGYSLGDDGIGSGGIVANSYGYSAGTDANAYGIDAYIAIGCRTGGGENIVYKYNMP